MGESDPGVPEAMPRILRLLAERLGTERIDRLWLFPPRTRGRKEWGLVVASAYVEDEEDGDQRRRLHTARYVAERTGRGVEFESAFSEEGTLPPGRFPRVMAGVVRRAEEDLGDPRSVELEGDPERLDRLLDEFDPPLPEMQQP